MEPISIVDACLDGSTVDILISKGRIERISPAGVVKPSGEILNASGGLVSPPYADPHLHLDAVLLGHSCPNQSGTLKEGIRNWAVARENLTEEDLLRRANLAVRWCVANGTGRIRTHVDCASMLAIEVLCQFRSDIAHLVDLQVVAFPQEGVFREPNQAAALTRAVKAGVDCVGAIPHHEGSREDGDRSIELAFDLAEAHGIRVDLHCDETDNPQSRHILKVCEEVRKRDFKSHVLAGHCTALHSYPQHVAEKTIDSIAESGVQVVANPLDNIVLQGRLDSYPKRRGITRIPELLEAGANVGVGHDSIVDPWYPLGSGNLLEAASMLIHVAHMTRPEQIDRVFQMLLEDNHAGFGGAVPIQEGNEANLLIHSVEDAQTAMRLKVPPRWVLRKGVIVAENIPQETRVLGDSVRIGLIP